MSRIVSGEYVEKSIIELLKDCKPKSFIMIRDAILPNRRGRFILRKSLANLVRRGVVARIPAYERKRMEFILRECLESER